MIKNPKSANVTTRKCTLQKPETSSRENNS